MECLAKLLLHSKAEKF